MKSWAFPDYRIVQFSRAPDSGRIKTRLAEVLNEAARLELHLAMTRWTSERSLGAALCPLELWVDGDPAQTFFGDLRERLGLSLHSQTGGDLGQRMASAAEAVLGRGKGLILIGSDCPFVDADYLRQALEHLQRGETVLGPARDGGYVLLGLRQLHIELFCDIPWGSEHVLAVTEERLAGLGLRCHRLPTLPDIDRPADLAALDHPELPAELRRFARFAPA